MLDTKSGVIVPKQVPCNDQSKQAGSCYDDAWDCIVDDTSPPGERAAALRVVVESDEDRAAAFLADELERRDISSEWQGVLVLCAESAQVHDDALRRRLWARLLEIALSDRQEPDDAAAKPVVFSAIRCATSMIPLSELDRLLPFLDPPAPLETRLVTLQCIVNVFEAGPPAEPGQFAQLGDRISELALKFLDRDRLVAGQLAAISLNAIQALACLGDERLSTCLSRALALGIDWFNSQLMRKLRETADSWAALENCGQRSILLEHLAMLEKAPGSSN